MLLPSPRTAPTIPGAVLFYEAVDRSGAPGQGPPRREDYQPDDDETERYTDQPALGTERTTGKEVVPDFRLADQAHAPVGRAAHGEPQERPLHEVPGGVQPDRHPDTVRPDEGQSVHEPPEGVARHGQRRRVVVGRVDEAEGDGGHSYRDPVAAEGGAHPVQHEHPERFSNGAQRSTRKPKFAARLPISNPIL
jgi:hypothetical protein